MTKAPRIWALLGAHAGDNNQILALAESLGLPFEIIQLRYNGWRLLGPRLLGASLISLEGESRAGLSGDLPDLTISAGHRSVPIVQHIRRRSGGRTRSVHVGYPRIAPERFDLVVATEEYPVRDGPNVLRIPIALTRERADLAPIESMPAPCRLLVLGGPTLYWRLETKTILDAVSRLVDAASLDGGSVIAVASPRTPPRLFDQIQRRLAKAAIPTLAVPASGPPSYPTLLASADQLFVTADSVAMVSDAIATGKPVGLVSVRPTAICRAYAGMLKAVTRMRPRDLRFFWKTLEDRGLVGTIEEPRCGGAPNVNMTVAARVRQLLGLE